MNTVKDFMDSYLLAKLKTEKQHQELQARWVEPITIGLQAAIANQLGGTDATEVEQPKY